MSVNVDILRHGARRNNSKKSGEKSEREREGEGERGRTKGGGEESESSYQDNEKYTVRAFIRRINATKGRAVRANRRRAVRALSEG